MLERAFLFDLTMETSILEEEKWDRLHYWWLKAFKTPLPNLIFAADSWGTVLHGRNYATCLSGLAIDGIKQDQKAFCGEALFIYPLARGIEIKLLNTLILEEIEVRAGYEGGRLYDKKGKLVEKEDTGKAEIVLGLGTIEQLQFGLRLGVAKSLLDERKKAYLGFTMRAW